MDEHWSLARKRENLWIRAHMIQAVRSFFIEREYLEIETPNRIPAPAPECHIDAVPSVAWFLHTSPELCMKRLLAAGFSKIFQICKCYRQNERGRLHLSEFTLLEWYRSGADYLELMDECESLLCFVALRLGKGDSLIYKGDGIDLQPPWERISVKEAFERYSPTSLAECMEADRFEEMLVSHVEPRLGWPKPTFLFDYPASMASLARINSSDLTVAERFELYIAGMEVANAFSELTDGKEQRERFAKEESSRRLSGKMPYPSPEPFLRAMSSMPESAGIALGLDRLAILLTDAAGIDDVVTFTPETL
ncbi:MAG: EF-P lysine aminoacylase EpmA [Syntrophales bacterium]|nr:EF-P lysine aminoacylase EpmA [Syntrophales bacterium]